MCVVYYWTALSTVHATARLMHVQRRRQGTESGTNKVWQVLASLVNFLTVPPILIHTPQCQSET